MAGARGSHSLALGPHVARRTTLAASRLARHADESEKALGLPCIVVGNAPRAYREVLAAALMQLRPDMEVCAVDPADLDAKLLRLTPQLVVCSELTRAVEGGSFTWVLLYPDGATRAEICARGERTCVGDLEFAQLLDLLDQPQPLAS
jgi:hypothetical protein